MQKIMQIQVHSIKYQTLEGCFCFCDKRSDGQDISGLMFCACFSAHPGCKECLLGLLYTGLNKSGSSYQQGVSACRPSAH